MNTNNDILELVQVMKEIRDCLVQLIDFEKEKVILILFLEKI